MTVSDPIRKRYEISDGSPGELAAKAEEETVSNPGNVQDVLDRLSGEWMSRRALMKRAGLLGISAAGVSSLLAACGGDDDDEPEEDTEPTVAAAANTETGDAEPTTAAEEDDSTAGTDEPTAASDETAEGESTSVPDQGAGEGRPGGTLTFAKQGSRPIDPQVDYGIGTGSIQLNVYDTLISPDLEGFLGPGLAESWETQGDNTYIFTLREGVTFHDGSPFTAADVIFSFERMLDEANGASLRPQMELMETFEATDDFTVQVVLSEPYATFLAVLANRAATIVSRAFEGDYTSEMNGTGPFMLDSFEPDVKYTLVKNPNYWQAGLPYLDKVELTPIPDESARIAAFQSGQVNFSEYIPYQYMNEVDEDENFTLYKGYDIYNYVRINVNRAPMDNPLVRQALNYAVDRSAHIDIAFGGQGIPMTAALIPTDDPVWYNSELDGHWTYDPDKALALLAEAGYEDPSTLKFTVESSSEPNHLDSAQVLVGQFQAIGISADLVPLESAIRVEKRSNGDYTIMFDGAANQWTDPDFYSLIVASDGPVYATGVGYNNPEVDRLLEEGRSTLDEAERKDIYKQLEEVLLEDAPFIFLYWRPQAEACAANVKGYTRVPGVGYMSVQFLENLWIDE